MDPETLQKIQAYKAEMDRIEKENAEELRQVNNSKSEANEAARGQ